jgi:hypothetical protein
MRRRLVPLWIVGGCVGLLLGTGVGRPSDSGASDPPAAPAAAGQRDFDPITKVTPGMTMLDVLREVGPPSDMKGAIYYYKRRGRIVFEGSGTPGDKTKVLRVEEDVLEDGMP